MAHQTLKHGLWLLVVTLAIAQMANAGDPNILSDFILPPNVTDVDSTFFTFTGFQAIADSKNTTTFKVTKASTVEFPALNGQSVSYAALQYPVGSANPPHTHPRSAELLLVMVGSLEVGFVDTTNKLYTRTLYAGDMFVFPKGLVHYQYNTNAQDSIPTLAFSAFGSASAGTVSLPATIFATGIDDTILATSFKTDVETVQKLKAGLAPKP